MNKIGQEVRKESRFCKEPCNVIVIAKDPLFKNDVKKFITLFLTFLAFGVCLQATFAYKTNVPA
jgi:hypothetical protein